ncbi:MAG: GNAT family N-acetyltransferase, partial [Caldimonas sp.]
MNTPVDPILLDVPERIETARLVLRMPKCGDGAAVNAAVAASHAELASWLPWASALPSVDESEIHCRRQLARFILREDFVMLMFERIGGGVDGTLAGEGQEGACVGALGLHRIDWALRRFEIGYWCKTGCGGRGYVTEAVRAISRMAFDSLAARRVEIRVDD